MKITLSGNLVNFTFDGAEPLTLDTTKAHESDKHIAMLMGFSDKCRDAAAIPKTLENNYTITEAMRRAAIAPMVERFEKGEASWNIRVAKTPAENPVIRKIAEKRGITYTEAQALIAEQFLNELA